MHKCAELARLQLDAGAIGVTTATVAEAVAMAEAGVPDVLVASEVVSPVAIARLAEAARTARIRVAVDDAGVLAATGRAAVGAGVELGVLVDVDVGLDRGGARSTEEALRLAELAAATDGVSFDGLMGYEGHCASEPDAALRARRGARARWRASPRSPTRAAARASTSSVVSAGATGTFEVTGAAPGVTEVQAGSYVLMDRFHAPLVDGFGFALTVMATVIGRHGDLLVLDAGRKAVDDEPPPARAARPARHARVHPRGARRASATTGEAPGAVGDRVHIVPGYAPTTVNLFGAYHVVEDGRVVDVWPVLARHGDP